MKQALVVIASPKENWSVVLFGGLAALCLLLAVFSSLQAQPPSVVTFFLAAAAFFALCIYVDVLRQSRTVTLNAGLDYISVKDRNLLFMPRERRYARSRFAFVCSYFTQLHPTANRVELLCDNQRDGLLLATAAPAFTRRGFFKAPTVQEHPEIVRVRVEAAAVLDLPDIGFLEHRKIGPQVRANEA